MSNDAYIFLCLSEKYYVVKNKIVSDLRFEEELFRNGIVVTGMRNPLRMLTIHYQQEEQLPSFCVYLSNGELITCYDESTQDEEIHLQGE